MRAGRRAIEREADRQRMAGGKRPRGQPTPRRTGSATGDGVVSVPVAAGVVLPGARIDRRGVGRAGIGGRGGGGGVAAGGPYGVASQAFPTPSPSEST